MSIPSGPVTLAKGDDSHLVEPRRFVVRDAQAFAAVWSAHAGPQAPAPPVDFRSRMVAAVFAGHRPTPGYTIDIRGTERDGSALVVVVDEHRPDPTLVAAQVIVSPYHIVTLPRDDGEIRFSTEDPTGQGTIIFKPTSRVPPLASASSDIASASPFDAADLRPSESTGLTPRVAASMAYLAGPFSAALLLATERRNPFVRFHAWQALVGLGALGIAALLLLILAFAMLVVSPTAFWTLLWMAALTAGTWVAVWLLCVVSAYRGKRWKLPLVGTYAERRAATGPAVL
jgi:uncharacterized membrane protein